MFSSVEYQPGDAEEEDPPLDELTHGIQVTYNYSNKFNYVQE